MKNYALLVTMAILLLVTTGCDKQKDDLVEPLSASQFPQVISFDDEGDGDLEDEDKFSFVLTLNDRVDPDGKELGGKIVPLEQDVTVAFKVDGLKGFAKISDYILDAEAFYEVDDCNTKDVALTFNRTTGVGTVTFPKGVEEVEIEFETNDALFDDNVLNTADREITFVLTGITGGINVVYNPAAEFTYEVLDDEAIHGEWELNHTNATEFANFKALFGLISTEVKNLNAADVKGIVISIEYDEVKVEIELKATETITECGSSSVENKVIEIEAGLEELDTKTLKGDIEFADDIEQNDGTLKEFVYGGKFDIVGKLLKLTLEGEYDDDTTPKITLNLEK